MKESKQKISNTRTRLQLEVTFCSKLSFCKSYSNHLRACLIDDANVTRFCSLLDELTKITNTKFIIITHHALTMSRMDRLYGVTMAEQGVSQLVSVDLQRAEELVA